MVADSDWNAVETDIFVDVGAIFASKVVELDMLSDRLIGGVGESSLLLHDRN